ncbi:MAG: hypothetical protein AAFR24_19530 [Cyanobacteria bacterium J06627_3]
MSWLILLAAAFVFAMLGRRLKPADEIYGIATYSAGLLSIFWGFAIAPFLAQLTLIVVALAWLQLGVRRLS